MKRQVAGQQRDLERLDGFARVRCRDDGVTKFFDLIDLVVRDVEDVFVDEALLRDGAGDRQPLIGQVVRTLMQFIQQCAPRCRRIRSSAIVVTGDVLRSACSSPSLAMNARSPELNRSSGR